MPSAVASRRTRRVSSAAMRGVSRRAVRKPPRRVLRLADRNGGDNEPPDPRNRRISWAYAGVSFHFPAQASRVRL